MANDIEAKIQSEMLKKLQYLLLTILKDVIRVCQEEKIDFFLCGGTLLGAIRHKGFIPWDDDIDICMTRENFERFEKIANTKLQKCFFYQSPNTDSECSSYCCGRVRLEGTHFESTSLPNNWKHSGIFIDILPLEKIPNDYCTRLLYFYFFQIIIRIYWLRNGYKPHPKNKLFNFVMHFLHRLSKPVPSSWLKKQLETYHLKYDKNYGEDRMVLLESSCKKSIIKNEEFSQICYMDFEGVSCPIPEKYDSYLSRLYGNYMELPPENERIPHHLEKIDFGNY